MYMFVSDWTRWEGREAWEQQTLEWAVQRSEMAVKVPRFGVGVSVDGNVWRAGGHRFWTKGATRTQTLASSRMMQDLSQ